jgi:small subunit ribosomal protein S6
MVKGFDAGWTDFCPAKPNGTGSVRLPEATSANARRSAGQTLAPSPYPPGRKRYRDRATRRGTSCGTAARAGPDSSSPERTGLPAEKPSTQDKVLRIDYFLLPLRHILYKRLIQPIMNHYETVFIATPVLSDVQTKELFGKFQGVITENGGQIVSSEDWGLRKLAYPIQKKTTGFYYLIEFEGEGDLVEKLETQYRRDERVIRFLTFRMDKYAVEYAEKRRNKNKSKQE